MKLVSVDWANNVMSEVGKGERQEGLPNPFQLLGPVVARWRSEVALREARDIEAALTTALQFMTQEVQAPAGYWFAIIPRDSGEEVWAGNFFPQGVYGGKGMPLLDARRVVVARDDEPFLAERVAVVGEYMFAVHADGSARELKYGREDFSYVERPDIQPESLATE